MTIAEQIKRQIDKERSLDVCYQIAFRACKWFDKYSQSVGWGDGKEWTFPDGSLMRYDGRGFTT